MPKLWLHAGFHKTGTTAIQRFAARNRRSLQKGGILYPRLWPTPFRPAAAHHFLAHAVAGNEKFLSFRQARALVGRWHGRAATGGLSVLLSSEAICRQVVGTARDRLDRQRAYLVRLAELFKDFEVCPILVIRRQDDFVRSLYQEHVAGGIGDSACLTFPEFVSRSGMEKAAFLERIRLFQRVFGQVRVMVYEELAAEGLPRAFFARLGVRELKGGEVRPVRQSLSVGETMVKQRLNRLVRNRRQNRLLLAWMRSGRVRRIIDRELGGYATLWPDAQVRGKFMAGFEEENRTIAREFLNRGGDPFPSLEPGPDSGTSAPENERVLAVASQVAGAARWRLKAIAGPRAVKDFMQAS